MHDALLRLFRRRFGVALASTSPVAPDGSHRTMTRLAGPRGETAIAVEGPDTEENRAFLSFTASFSSIGLPVPEVYGVDDESGTYLVQDLGDTTLFRALSDARAGSLEFPASLVPVYRRVLEWLPRFQVDGGHVVDYAVAHPRAAFDRQSMQWDLDYFKYHFAKLARVPFNEDRLQRDFDRLIERLLSVDTSHFLYRDFQSRNVMLVGEREAARPWFIDYQGGRRGALGYDVASLLYDAKAAIPPALREELLAHYLGALHERLPVDPERFRRDLRGYVLIRILQAMGAYGYRGFFERKTHFLQSVPHALRNVEGLLSDGFVDVELPELRALLERICARDDLRRMPDTATPAIASSSDATAGLSSPASAAPITVRVGSFSYRLGYPTPSDHGGGFVFDCRALPNPGLLPALAPYDGRHANVGAFLDSAPDVATFLDRAWALVSAQAEAYLERGYDALDVHFGCTGGRHRSVYCAERMAARLREKFAQARVELSHREQTPRWDDMPALFAKGGERGADPLVPPPTSAAAGERR